MWGGCPIPPLFRLAQPCHHLKRVGGAFRWSKWLDPSKTASSSRLLAQPSVEKGCPALLVQRPTELKGRVLGMRLLCNLALAAGDGYREKVKLIDGRLLSVAAEKRAMAADRRGKDKEKEERRERETMGENRKQTDHASKGLKYNCICPLWLFPTLTCLNG